MPQVPIGPYYRIPDKPTYPPGSILRAITPELLSFLDARYIASGEFDELSYDALVAHLIPGLNVSLVPDDAINRLAIASIGGTGAISFEHSQASGSTYWIINHNLGYRPQVQAFSSGGVEIIGDLLHVSVNQATITFASAEAGFARCI